MALTKIDLQPALVIHRRKYRESSLLIELLTKDYGLVALVARGARKSRDRTGLIQPFHLLQISWQSRSELGTLTQVELVTNHAEFNKLPICLRLQGTALYCGLYINELISRVCHRGLMVEGLFESYLNAIIALEQFNEESKVLRVFEWQLIKLCGYGFSLDETADSQRVVKDNYYIFQEHLGIVEVIKEVPGSITGNSLLALHQGEWHDKKVLLEAKVLFNQVIKTLAGEKPFAARALYSGLLANKHKKTEKKHE